MKPALIAAIILAMTVCLAPRSKAEQRSPDIATTAQDQIPQVPNGNAASQWILVIVTAITAGFICWQAWETRRSARAAAGSVAAIREQVGLMERQTKATEAAAVAAKDGALAAKLNAEATQASINIIISKERSRIRVTPKPLDLLHPIKTLHFADYDVSFYGTTPAFIFDTAVWADAVESEDSATFPLWVPITELPSVVPHTTSLISCRTLLDLEPQLVDEVSQGKRFVRLYGFIRYKDVFDFVRATTFRYTWQIPSLYGITAGGGWVKNGSGGDNAET